MNYQLCSRTIIVIFVFAIFLDAEIGFGQNTLKEDFDHFAIVLGTTQDAGSPQLGCNKPCCRSLFKQPDPFRRVVSIGLVDRITNQTILIEATPDIRHQIFDLNQAAGKSDNGIPNATLITHAHIGHYTGLMYYGRESLSADKANVVVMPRMANFLKNNGPWDQLLTLNNITLTEIEENNVLELGSFKIEAIPVPHRDEYSETVAFRISGPNKTLLFIPDIDKWHLWNVDIVKLISEVDYAFIDATFYDAEEINNRDISEIPHPFVIETMELFDKQPESIRQKIHFIHFNHTNPLLNKDSKPYSEVINKKYKISSYLDRVQM